MDKIRLFIPNLFTLFNLACGCIALVFIFKKQYDLVWIFAFTGGIADVWDGLVARLLKAYTELGKQLDSLADLVSSGVVPGAIMYMLLEESLMIHGVPFGTPTTLALVAFSISIFAAYRLGKFNVDDEQTLYFKGLPTPAAMIYVVGLMMIAHTDAMGLRDFVLQPPLLLFSVAAISWLFVANISIFNIKFHNFKWYGNELRIVYLIFCGVILLTLRWVAVPIGIVVYVIISVIRNFVSKNN